MLQKKLKFDSKAPKKKKMVKKQMKGAQVLSRILDPWFWKSLYQIFCQIRTTAVTALLYNVEVRFSAFWTLFHLISNYTDYIIL